MVPSAGRRGFLFCECTRKTSSFQDAFVSQPAASRFSNDPIDFDCPLVFQRSVDALEQPRIDYKAASKKPFSPGHGFLGRTGARRGAVVQHRELCLGGVGGGRRKDGRPHPPFRERGAIAGPRKTTSAFEAGVLGSA